MIKYEWRDQLSAAETSELNDLLDRAAAFDAEAEHNTIPFADVQAAVADPSGSARHLLIWMLPHVGGTDFAGQPERIAGVVRMVFSTPETAELTVVIEPGLRAIGILTLLLEHVGVDTTGPDGWLGTGARQVTAWARGNHPATGRISDRFLISRTRSVWKLVRPIATGDADSKAEVTRAPLVQRIGAISVDLDPARSTVTGQFGRCATIAVVDSQSTADSAAVRELLDKATEVAAQQGFAAVVMHVDSADADLVNACRRSGFQHDRTDVRYALGEHR